MKFQGPKVQTEGQFLDPNNQNTQNMQGRMYSPSRAGFLPSPSTPTMNVPSREKFIEGLQVFYDQFEETSRLNFALREQIRKSTVLLQTLQGSGHMIEGLVRNQVREIMNAESKKQNLLLEALDARLSVIENHLGIDNEEH
jgi:hypothetical protein